MRLFIFALFFGLCSIASPSSASDAKRMGEAIGPEGNFVICTNYGVETFPWGEITLKTIKPNEEMNNSKVEWSIKHIFHDKISHLLYCSENFSGKIYILDDKDFTLKRMMQGRRGQQKLCVTNGVLYIMGMQLFVEEDSALYLLPLQGQHQLTQLITPSPFDFIVVDHTLYSSNLNGLLVYDLQTNTEVKTLNFGSKPGGVTYHSNKIYVATSDWKVQVIDCTNNTFDVTIPPTTYLSLGTTSLSISNLNPLSFKLKSQSQLRNSEKSGPSITCVGECIIVWEEGSSKLKKINLKNSDIKVFNLNFKVSDVTGIDNTIFLRESAFQNSTIYRLKEDGEVVPFLHRGNGKILVYYRPRIENNLLIQLENNQLINLRFFFQ